MQHYIKDTLTYEQNFYIAFAYIKLTLKFEFFCDFCEIGTQTLPLIINKI